MRKRDRRHAPRRATWLPVVLVLLVLGGASAAYLGGLTDRRSTDGPQDPVTVPAEVPPPAGIDVAAVSEPEPVAAPAAAGSLLPGAVRRAVARALADPDLGPSGHVHAAVAGLGRGAPAYERGAGAFMPASTLKLLTTTAALATLGPDHRFETTVVARGRVLTLVGGGDPTLARVPSDQWPDVADVRTLARRTAAEIGSRKPVTLRYDTSLFTGPEENTYWRADYVPDDIVSPIDALWVDEGIAADRSERVADPAADAAAAFAAALGEQGVTVRGTPTSGTAPEEGRPVATVSSPPLSQIVEHVVEVSDNEGAEVLARHVGLAVTGDGSFAGGVRGVRETLADLGVPLGGAVLRDGSGLSRTNLVRAVTLLGVLRVAAREPDLRAVVTGLPVAAFSGSLMFRFDEAPDAGVGRVRAKTGSLGGVRSLAGIVTDRTGTPMLFVLAADRIRERDLLEAEQDLDNVAGALGACVCSS